MRRLIAVGLFAILALSTIATATAYYSYTYRGDGTYVSMGGYHTGTKSTTYRFENSTVKLYYEQNMKDGASKWGSSISCTYSGSGQGVVKMNPDRNARANYATAANNQNWATGHQTPNYIEIWIPYDDIADTSKRASILAHEIGHWYGLDHVSYSNYVMYTWIGGLNNYAGSYEKKAIETCAHTYEPANSTNKTYTPLNRTQHTTKDNTSQISWEDAHIFSNGYCTSCGVKQN